MTGYPANPVLVEYHRGGMAESVHRGALFVLQEDKILEERGEVHHSYFIRSCAKPFQAMALVASGAAGKFKLSDEELALTCASHGGEDVHATMAASLLKKGGVQESDLQCGTHAPFDKDTAAGLRAGGKRAGPLRHNCSGKHAGMLLLARFLDAPIESYLDPDHPVQIRIRDILAQVCEISPEDIKVGIDGCSAPTFGLSLPALARGFCNWTNPENLPEPLQGAARTLAGAVASHPGMFGGKKQLDSRFVEATGGSLLAKRGAEGVYAAGFPGRKIGAALKVDDGTTRCLGFLLASLFRRHGLLSGAEQERLADLLETKIKNYSGRQVGEIREILK